MKCSSPFIIAYNRLFCFLHEKGYGQLSEFWDLLEDAVLGQLRFLAKTKGLVGMLQYWSDVLTDEGADFDIHLVENVLRIVIYKCPSIQKLKDSGEHVFQDYCGHCQRMYPKALEPLGYAFEIHSSAHACCITVRKIQCQNTD